MEGGGEERCEGGVRDGAAFGGVEDPRLRSGEFEDGLAAGSAGLAGGGVEVGDGDGAELDGGAMLGDGAGDGSLLRAGGEAVRGVFDVAARDGFASDQEQGRADAEAAVGGVGVVCGLLGKVVQGGDLGGGEAAGVGFGHDRRVAGVGVGGKFAAFL